MGDEAKDEKPDTINLKVVAQDGNIVFFKLGMSTRMHRLMTAYCQRQGVDMQAVRFLFDGARLRETHTPDDVDMEDGDAIDVMVEQAGC